MKFGFLFFGDSTLERFDWYDRDASRGVGMVEEAGRNQEPAAEA
jgi:hypothetical protein